MKYLPLFKKTDILDYSENRRLFMVGKEGFEDGIF